MTPAAPTSSTTPAAPASPPTTPLPDDALPGDPHDGPPVHGLPAEVLVLGVAADDVLHVRRAPGVDQPVVADLAPLAVGVPATGRARLLPGSIWVELEVDGVVGWANARFLAHPGPTDDVTSSFIAEHGRLTAADVMALGIDIGSRRASVDPPSEVVVVDGPRNGDLAEVTVDVVGLGDDAQRAERLVVFAVELEDGSVELRTIEATQLCARHAGDDAGCP